MKNLLNLLLILVLVSCTPKTDVGDNSDYENVFTQGGFEWTLKEITQKENDELEFVFELALLGDSETRLDISIFDLYTQVEGNSASGNGGAVWDDPTDLPRVTHFQKDEIKTCRIKVSSVYHWTMTPIPMIKVRMIEEAQEQVVTEFELFDVPIPFSDSNPL